MVSVAVLGAAGGIGQPLCLLLRQNPLVTSLVLYDIANAAGVAADLSHVPTAQQIKGVSPTSKDDTQSLAAALKGVDVVVIPAGIPRKPGMTRDDLFKINAGIVRSLVAAVGKACPDAMLCIISNPVNSTVPIAVQELKRQGVYNAQRVFGITTLDNLRLEQFLAEKVGVEPADLEGDVMAIGGHSGDSIVPIINSWRGALAPDVYEALVHRVQYGGDEVVKAKDGKGSATLSMAVAAYRFVDKLVQAMTTSQEVVQVAFVKVDELDCHNVPKDVLSTGYFALPCVFTAAGVTAVRWPQVDPDVETAMVRTACAKVVKDVQTGFDFVHGSKL